MSGASVKMTAVACSTFLSLRAAVVRSRTALKGDSSGSSGSPTSERPCPPLLYRGRRACRLPSSRPRGAGGDQGGVRGQETGDGVDLGALERLLKREGREASDDPPGQPGIVRAGPGRPPGHTAPRRITMYDQTQARDLALHQFEG